jgi:hypothetical protein
VGLPHWHPTERSRLRTDCPMRRTPTGSYGVAHWRRPGVGRSTGRGCAPAREVLGASVLRLFEQVTLIRSTWFTCRQAASRSGRMVDLLSGTVTFVFTGYDKLGA